MSNPTDSGYSVLRSTLSHNSDLRRAGPICYAIQNHSFEQAVSMAEVHRPRR